MKTLALAAALALPSLAGAQVRYVDGAAAPGGDGLGWASAHDDLQEALSEARVNPGVTEVWVAEGRYRPTSSPDRTIAFELVNGLALYGGFMGNESQPCIDVSPLSFGAGADFERDPSELDGDLDGTLEFDMGADEHNPVRLSIQGSTSAGSTLTIDLAGPPGFAALLAIGRSGQRFIPGVGTLFLNFTGSLRVPWPSAPSSVPVLVPPGLFGLYHPKALVFGGGVFVPSNYVPLTF